MIQTDGLRQISTPVGWIEDDTDEGGKRKRSAGVASFSDTLENVDAILGRDLTCGGETDMRRTFLIS